MAKKKHRPNDTTSTSSANSAAARRRERVSSQRTGSATPSAPSATEKRRRAVRQNWWQRNSLAVIGGILLVVVIVIGAFVIIANSPAQQGSTGNGNGTIGATNPDILKKVTTIPQSVFANVNTGGTQNRVTVPPGNPAALTDTEKKPIIFYYGAEFCPYCAAERWSLTIALARFGTFTSLPLTTSADASAEPDLPSIPTFTYHGAQYSSNYIDFQPVELEDRFRQPLENPTALQQQLVTEFNVTGFPFLDIGNKYLIDGQTVDPTILKGLSQKDIADLLSDPSQGITQSIVGTANYMTAAICLATNGNPGSVCNSDPIKALSHTLATNATASLPAHSPLAFSSGSAPADSTSSRRRTA